MRRIAAKFGFIHRRLWARNATYRVAFLAGPPPLIGMAVASVIWLGMHMGIGPAGQAPGSGLPWAHYTPAAIAAEESASPIMAKPDGPLPIIQADGMPMGLTTGWTGDVLPITLSPALDVDVLPTPLASFSLDQAAIDLDHIVAASPRGGLFVGAEHAVLVIRSAGVYGLSIVMERMSDRPADCLQRLVFANRRLVSNVRLGVTGAYTHSYDPILFDLRPGLYRIIVVFGCWSGEQAAGPGRLKVLIRHPGDPASVPAGPNEIMHPASAHPSPGQPFP